MFQIEVWDSVDEVWTKVGNDYPRIDLAQSRLDYVLDTYDTMHVRIIQVLGVYLPKPLQEA